MAGPQIHHSLAQALAIATDPGVELPARGTGLALRKALELGGVSPDDAWSVETIRAIAARVLAKELEGPAGSGPGVWAAEIPDRG